MMSLGAGNINLGSIPSYPLDNDGLDLDLGSVIPEAATGEGEEYVPVESFFQAYVDALSDPAPEAPRLVPGVGALLPGDIYMHSGTQETNGLAQLRGGATPMAGVELGSPAAAPSTAANNMVTSGFDNARRASGSQGSGTSWRQFARASHSEGDDSGGAEEEPLDVAAVGGDGRNVRSRTGVRHETKTKRNAKQQAQNKQAQQRYRERRKQRFVELESTLDSTSAQLQQLQGVQQQNQALQGQMVELGALLRAKEAELSRLHSQLAASPEGAGDAPLAALDGTGEVESVLEPAAEAKQRKRQATEAEIAAYMSDRAENVARVRDYVEQHGLRNVDPLGGGVPAEVVATVKQLVVTSCGMCKRAMRAEGVKVLALMSKDLTFMTRIECHKLRAKWTHILGVLRLSGPQSTQLIELRKSHLASLRTLYEDRQRLNMQAMSLMLPPAVQREDAPDDPVAAKLECMTLNGYMHCARTHVRLDEVLDTIRDNLRREQKTVMELNFVTMNRVLSPIQAALFVVEAFPGHCDCLALANIQASLLHIADANPLHHCDGYPDVKPKLADIRATSSSGDKSETIPSSL
ncbi:hypothetical protein WJX81_006202 [Elliptochloris bilobata]|uniref:BZIP domain-containing protein n=1 Tax=Elliptochloris bilobata TaxID=381761 RepID=A0AAW1RU42_9CHLO